jgi:hypothetical protein
MSAVTAEGHLFGTDSMASEPPPSPTKVPVDKTFLRYDQGSASGVPATTSPADVRTNLT